MWRAVLSSGDEVGAYPANDFVQAGHWNDTHAVPTCCWLRLDHTQSPGSFGIWRFQRFCFLATTPRSAIGRSRWPSSAPGRIALISSFKSSIHPLIMPEESDSTSPSNPILGRLLFLFVVLGCGTGAYFYFSGETVEGGEAEMVSDYLV